VTDKIWSPCILVELLCYVHFEGRHAWTRIAPSPEGLGLPSESLLVHWFGIWLKSASHCLPAKRVPHGMLWPHMRSQRQQQRLRRDWGHLCGCCVVGRTPRNQLMFSVRPGPLESSRAEADQALPAALSTAHLLPLHLHDMVILLVVARSCGGGAWGSVLDGQVCGCLQQLRTRACWRSGQQQHPPQPNAFWVHPPLLPSSTRQDIAVWLTRQPPLTTSNRRLPKLQPTALATAPALASRLAATLHPKLVHQTTGPSLRSLAARSWPARRGHGPMVVLPSAATMHPCQQLEL